MCREELPTPSKPASPGRRDENARIWSGRVAQNEPCLLGDETSSIFAAVSHNEGAQQHATPKVQLRSRLPIGLRPRNVESDAEELIRVVAAHWSRNLRPRSLSPVCRFSSRWIRVLGAGERWHSLRRTRSRGLRRLPHNTDTRAMSLLSHFNDHFGIDTISTEPHG